MQCERYAILRQTAPASATSKNSAIYRQTITIWSTAKLKLIPTLRPNRIRQSKIRERHLTAPLSFTNQIPTNYIL